jgi:hypothetical protein
VAWGYEAESATWVRSGQGVSQAADTLGDAVGSFYRELAGAGAAWGCDDIGRAFFDGDGSTAGFAAMRDQLLAHLVDMVNLLRATGGMLVLSGHRYALAEEASTIGAALPRGAASGAAAAADTYRLPSVAEGTVESDPPPGEWLQILWLLESVVGGCTWPDGNIAALGRIRDAFTAMASALAEAAGEVDGYARVVTSNNAGAATEKFASFAEALTRGGEEGGLLWLNSACQGLAASVDVLIEEKNAARIQFRLSCAFLIAMWAAAWALSWLTGGGSVAAATEGTEAEGLALRAYVQAAAKVVAAALRNPVIAGAIYSSGLNAAGQGAQILAGLQNHWNWGQTGLAAAEGAVAGAVMGESASWVAEGGNPVTARLAAWMQDDGLLGKVTRLGVAGASGTAGNVATQALFNDGHIDIGQAAAFGLGMAGLGEILPEPEIGHQPEPDGGSEPPDLDGSEQPGGHADPAGTSAPPAADAPRPEQLASADRSPMTGADQTVRGGDPAGDQADTLTAPDALATGSGPPGRDPAAALAAYHIPGDETAGFQDPRVTGASQDHAQSGIPGTDAAGTADTGAAVRPTIAQLLGGRAAAGAAVDTRTALGVPGDSAAAAPSPAPAPVPDIPPRQELASAGQATLAADGPRGVQPFQGDAPATAPADTRPGHDALATGSGDPVHAAATEQSPGHVAATATAGIQDPGGTGVGQDRAPLGIIPRDASAAGPAPAPAHGDAADAAGSAAAARQATGELPGGRAAADAKPDTRTPLLHILSDRALSELRGRYANTIDPREALRAAQWAELRESASPHEIVRTGTPFDRAATVDVRRMLVSADGSDHPVTEFTLRVRYQADPAMTAPEILRAKSSALDGADLYFNHQHQLPADGSQLHMRVEFEEAPRARADDVVTLRPGRGDGPGDRINPQSWYADMPTAVYGHELGHLLLGKLDGHLGTFDEYVSADSLYRRTLTAPGSKPDASLLGDPRLSWSDGSPVVDHEGRAVPGLAGIRDRHLERLGELAEPAATGPDRGAAGVATAAEEWARREYFADSLRLPDHVSRMLESFPADGPDFLDYVRRLDRAHALFGDSVPADRLTTDHLAYSDALAETAGRAYGTGPEYSFTATQLGRLRDLADVLGFRPDGPLPRPDPFAQAAGEVLGHDSGDQLSARDLDGLARLAERLKQTADWRASDEPPSETLRQAAARLLGERPSPEAARETAHLLTVAADSGHTLPGDADVEGLRQVVSAARQEYGDGHPDAVVRAAASGRMVHGDDYRLTPEEFRRFADLDRRGSTLRQSAEMPRIEIHATGSAPPSDIFAEPHRIEEWDALSAGPGHPGSLDDRIAAIKASADVPLPERLQQIRDELLPSVGDELSQIASRDQKHLRFYAWMSGEVYIHGAALMLDPETTIEIAYHGADHIMARYQDEAHDSYLTSRDPAPDGMTAGQVDAARAWRSLHGRDASAADPAELGNDLIDMYARPLKEALAMRRTLIDDYGIDPRRVRLTYDDPPSRLHYTESRLERAHLFSLEQIRAAPTEARQQIVDALEGGEGGASRQAIARAVAERVYTAHERAGDQTPETPVPEEYALLWVGDRRTQAFGVRQYDTRPEFVRQTIETLRDMNPDRRILLVGDDLFANRPELRARWEREGVLDDVDTKTLVRFWEAEKNDGHQLTLGEQALFFHYLHSERDVIQVGMESGAMELPALLGTPSVYFEALEHDGNKGWRWQLYWDEWRYSRGVEPRDASGELIASRAGREASAYGSDAETLPPPLPTFRRVQFGPPLPDVDDWAVAVHQLTPVSLAPDRISRLVDSGELDQWPRSLGRYWSSDESAWHSWDQAEWDMSRYHADQLQHWLNTEATDQEEAARKWSAISNAVTGIVDPRDPRVISNYHDRTYHIEIPPEAESAVGQAYSQGLADRGSAVTEAIKELVGGAEFRNRAAGDLRLFRLSPAELEDLRQTIRRVLAARSTR